MVLHTVSVLALILSLTGNILVNYKKRFGFVIWSVSNIVWIVVNFMSYFNVSQVVMYLVYLCLNIQGFIVWGKPRNNIHNDVGGYVND